MVLPQLVWATEGKTPTELCLRPKATDRERTDKAWRKETRGSGRVSRFQGSRSWLSAYFTANWLVLWLRCPCRSHIWTAKGRPLPTHDKEQNKFLGPVWLEAKAKRKKGLVYMSTLAPNCQSGGLWRRALWRSSGCYLSWKDTGVQRGQGQKMHLAQHDKITLFMGFNQWVKYWKFTHRLDSSILCSEMVLRYC